jgi:small subunit ribosomal protein S6
VSLSTKATAQGIPKVLDNQLYELAYHIEPTVQEDQLMPLKDELEKLVTDQGGTIVFSKEPERSRLSYPIHNERMSYFGYVHFNVADKDSIAHIDEQLRLNNHVMRHLLIKIDDRRAAVAKLPTGQPERRVRKETAARKDGKEIEKQLEDVISGL